MSLYEPEAGQSDDSPAKGGKFKVKAKPRSSRAGLQFPVGRIHRYQDCKELLTFLIILSQISPQGKLRPACGSRSSSLPGCRDGVLGRRDPQVGRQRCHGQQEDQDHPQTSSGNLLRS